MSFRVWKRESDATPRAEARRPQNEALPADLIAAGARRVTVLALLTAAATLLFTVIDHATGRVEPTSATFPLWLTAGLLSLSISLAVAWVASREMLAPEALLDFGLLYQVIEALCLSVMFYAVPVATHLRGWSAVAVWILAYPLVVPNTRGKTMLATFAAAAMDPLGLMLQILAGLPKLQAGDAVLLFVPTLVTASIAVIFSGILYRLTVEAGKGMEMGSYHLEELLGRGGMGEVWRASHRLLARPSAVKLIRPDSLGSDGRDLLKRFEREAKATAALRSPHTVDIYDFGTTEDGTFYYVMELLDGFDLETLVSRFGPVPPERTVHILAQACHSLAEAHQGGLIHRDVKPANVYVCRYGLEWDFVKLLDFGLVKSATFPESEGKQLTAAGVIAGTPGFMSPEIGLGNPDVDWRADIYSLGCVGYWLLTGHEVFEGGTPMQTVMSHIQKQPVAPSQRTPGRIPEALEEIILSCLQKDPNNRPQTMQELSERLRAVPFDNPWNETLARRWWLANGTGARPSAPSPPTTSSTAAPVPARWIAPAEDRTVN